MFKLEFDPANLSLAAAIGTALLEYGTGSTVVKVDTVAASKMRSSTVDVEQHVADPAPEDLADLGNAMADLGNVQSTVEQGADAAPAATGARSDKHGVPFDADYCANAADPFYKTGKTAGQWKKKKGVDQDEYDDWYARVKPAPTVEDTPIDTTVIFSGQQAAETPASTSAPVDAGAFMVWVSEMTTAGHFTQADVTAAYSVVGIGAADIFQGANAVQNIASLHGVLSAKVPA